MKTIILAGGLGTRLSEETVLKPKPMVEIGSMPILWHIMKTYSHYGHNDFVIALGYKGYVIKEFFLNWEHDRLSRSNIYKNIYCIFPFFYLKNMKIMLIFSLSRKL